MRISTGVTEATVVLFAPDTIWLLIAEHNVQIYYTTLNLHAHEVLKQLQIRQNSTSVYLPYACYRIVLVTATRKTHAWLVGW